MPLHMTGLVSRYELDHPDEKPPVKIEPLAYERVLKYNPNHGPDGKFSSGGGGRRGGTAGPPTEDAFGNPLKQRRKPLSDTYVLGELKKKNPKAVAAAEESYGALASRRAAYQRRIAGRAAHPGDAELAGARANYQQQIADRSGMSYRHALGGDPGTGGYKPPTPHGPYDIVKAKPGSSTRYKLVPHDASQDAPNTREDSSWVLEMGREGTKGMAGDKLNTKANRKIADKNIKALATAAAAKVTSWEEAHTRANEAEFENYHEVATIFRARAKKLKH